MKYTPQLCCGWDILLLNPPLSGALEFNPPYYIKFRSKINKKPETPSITEIIEPPVEFNILTENEIDNRFSHEKLFQHQFLFFPTE